MDATSIECVGGGPLDGECAPEAVVDDENGGLAQFVILEHGDGTVDVYTCVLAPGRARYEYLGRMTMSELDELQDPE